MIDFSVKYVRLTTSLVLVLVTDVVLTAAASAAPTCCGR
jgi:hypothetical protein